MSSGLGHMELEAPGVLPGQRAQQAAGRSGLEPRTTAVPPKATADTQGEGKQSPHRSEVHGLFSKASSALLTSTRSPQLARRPVYLQPEAGTRQPGEKAEEPYKVGRREAVQRRVVVEKTPVAPGASLYPSTQVCLGDFKSPIRPPHPHPASCFIRIQTVL